MFSGIVEETAEVTRCSFGSKGGQLAIRGKLNHSETKCGDSLCVDGACLTVTEIAGSELSFDLSSESLRRTTLGEVKRGELLHIERSLRLADRIHGHLVFGHVDGQVKLVSRQEQGESLQLVWKYPENLSGLIVEKGSVAIAGVSLTVGSVTADQFDTYIVPHTLSCTRFAQIKIAAQLNLEVDMLGRYVQSLFSRMDSKGQGRDTERDLSWGFLAEHGYGKRE